MRTATAIYHAPPGDNKVCEMGGVTFFDGQSVEINSDDHGHLMNKLPTNQHFEFKAGEDDGKQVRGGAGRDYKAGVTEAVAHDFEDDRQEEQARRDERAQNERPKPEHHETPKRGRPPNPDKHK